MEPLVVFLLYLLPGVAWASIVLGKEMDTDTQTTTYPMVMVMIVGYPVYILKHLYGLIFK